MNLTCHYPVKSGNAAKDIKSIFDWAAALLDELNPLIRNLDAGNVREAASVKAQNIDTSSARISQAQIGALSADKLTSGSIDAEKISVKNISADEIKSGSLTLENGMSIKSNTGGLIINGRSIQMSDTNGVPRIYMGASEGGKFIFSLINAAGDEGLRLDEKGNLRVENCVCFNAEDRQYRGAGLRFVNEKGQTVRQMMVDNDGTIDFWGNNDIPDQAHRIRLDGHSLAFFDDLENLERRVAALEARP